MLREVEFTGHLDTHNYSITFSMGALAKGKGRFSLSDSDNSIGSFFSKEDLVEILEIDDVNGFYEAIASKHLLKEGYVDERDIYRQFKELKNEFSKIKLKRYISFDECVLLAIFRRTFPNAEIKQQVKIDTKFIDFEIKYNGVTKYVEFDGPKHFIEDRYNNHLEDLFERVKMIKQLTGSELVRWPYWIQRCSRNAKVLFDQSLQGYGALWTTQAYFNNFDIPQAAETIIKLTKRFNAEDESGIGYFYQGKEDERKQPEHHLIKQALKDPKKLLCFIPKNLPLNDPTYSYWLPKDLWNEYEKHYLR